MERFGFSGAGVDNFSIGFRVAALVLDVVSVFLDVTFFSLAALPRFGFVAAAAEVPFLVELAAVDFAFGFTAFVLALAFVLGVAFALGFAAAFFFGVVRPLVEDVLALLAATFFLAGGFFLATGFFLTGVFLLVVFLPAGALVLALAPDFRAGVFFRDAAIISPSAFLGMVQNRARTLPERDLNAK